MTEANEDNGIGKRTWNKIKSLSGKSGTPKSSSGRFPSFFQRTDSCDSKGKLDRFSRATELNGSPRSDSAQSQTEVFDSAIGQNGVQKQGRQASRRSSRLSSASENRISSHHPATAEREEFLLAYDKATKAVLEKLNGNEASQVSETLRPEVAPWNRQPGYLGHLTGPQQKALEQMKAWFPDCGRWHTDHDLLRFLRAREFDLQKTRQMYTKYLEEYRGNQMNSPNPIHRETIGFDESLGFIKSYPSRDASITNGMQIMREYFVHTAVISADKEGRPVVYFRPADIIKQNMNKYVPLAHRIAFQSAANESVLICMKELSRKKGFNIENVTQVLDLSGMSAMQMLSHMRSEESQQEWLHNMDFHPEMLHKIYVINAPVGMSAVWKFSSYFVPASTRKKVEVFGTSGYTSTLVKVIGKESLPTCYGGSFKFEWQKHKNAKELKKL